MCPFSRVHDLTPGRRAPDARDSVAPHRHDASAVRRERGIGDDARMLDTAQPRPGRERNHPRPRLAREHDRRSSVRARDELVDDTGEPDGYGVTARPAGRRVERDQARAGDEDNRPAALEERGRPTRDRTMRPQQLAGVEPVEPRNAVVADGEHSRPCRIDVHPDHGMPGRDDGAHARPIEREPQRVLRPGGRLDPRGLERELDPELGVAVEHGERARDELPGPRRASLVARLAPLGEREDRERRHCREGDERAESEKREPPVAATRVGARARDGALGVVTALPPEHRTREDVVEDLPASRLVRPEDPVVGKDAHDTTHVVIRAVRELCEVRRLVGDLHARGGDKVLEEQCRDVPLPGRQRLDRPLEVVGHDLCCAAEPGERRGPERRRATRRARRPTAAASRAAGTAPRCRARGRSRPACRGRRGRTRCAPRRRRRARRRPARPRSSRHPPRARSSARVASRSPRALRRGRAGRAGGRSRTGSGSRPSAGRATRACPPAARAGR